MFIHQLNIFNTWVVSLKNICQRSLPNLRQLVGRQRRLSSKEYSLTFGSC